MQQLLLLLFYLSLEMPKSTQTGEEVTDTTMETHEQIWARAETHDMKSSSTARCSHRWSTS